MKIIKQQTNTWISTEVYEVNKLPRVWELLTESEKTRILRDLIPVSTSLTDTSDTSLTSAEVNVSRETLPYNWIFTGLGVLLGGAMTLAVVQGVKVFS